MPFSNRLILAREAGLVLPEGAIVLFGADTDTDLSDLPDVQIVSRDARVHDRHRNARETAPDTAAAAIVLLSREKARARADLAAAAQVASDLIVVDGQKTEGIEPMLKALRSRTDVSGPVSKAHGKLFWCHPPLDLSDWAAAPLSVDGLRSWPGVFSATRVDRGSALLAAALPAKLGRSVCDLGAGWGWLSAQIADRVEALHMVEADGWALDCARANVPGAIGHWADVTRWESPRLFDSVIMNPPFHEGRKGVPDLGQAFIAKAADILAPTGQLCMVANRHLPYEATLKTHFGHVEEIGGDGRFKLFQATRPARRSRARTGGAGGSGRTVSRVRR